MYQKYLGQAPIHEYKFTIFQYLTSATQSRIPGPHLNVFDLEYDKFLSKAGQFSS